MEKEVFYNIINNAVKYIDPTRPGKIAVRGSAKDQYSIYCVEDGLGIRGFALLFFYSIILQ